MLANRRQDFFAGLKNGFPIGLGYFAVSVAIGLYWAKANFPPLSSALFSALNISSTGQFAGITIMAKRLGMVELGATTVLVNLRYFLMSISLSQRLPAGVGNLKRMLMAFGITDEIYALNIVRSPLTLPFYFGSMILPILGWSSGTFLGAIFGQLIPKFIQQTAGILLYAMFIWIVVAPLQKDSLICKCVLFTMLISTVFFFFPGLRELQVGWRIIIVSVLAATLMATIYPVSASKLRNSENLGD